MRVLFSGDASAEEQPGEKHRWKLECLGEEVYVTPQSRQTLLPSWLLERCPPRSLEIDEAAASRKTVVRTITTTVSCDKDGRAISTLEKETVESTVHERKVNYLQYRFFIGKKFLSLSSSTRLEKITMSSTKMFAKKFAGSKGKTEASLKECKVIKDVVNQFYVT